MATERVRKLCMAAFAVLLIPTAYGMITADFRLAAACVVAMIVVRVIGVRRP